MAGVVAMASVIEDFDTQPCKKSRKDAVSPVVKTITNYFSPVPKPAEKPFSPPRSNNIRDYFSRKAPSSKDKRGSPEQSKENCQTSQPAEKHTVREAGAKQPTQKRSRKASKAARKLVEAEPVNSTSDESCMIVEEQHDSRDSAAGAISSCGILGSDTAALLVQLSAEACISPGKSEVNDSETVGFEQAEKSESVHEDSSKHKPEIECIQLSPIAPQKEKAKQVKTVARNSRKRLQQEAKDSKPEEKENESSLCDVSMEVNVDETSQLNSTVTISFEDFVRSQGQDGVEGEDTRDERGKAGDGEITTDSEETDIEQMEIPKAEEKVVSTEPILQVSPRTLTIQAEVHTVSPKLDAKAGGKVASIFNRRKGAASPAELKSTSEMEAGKQLPSPSLTVKRKSNVVLQEEDLELSVLESESTTKCSDAERKQFMAAFKRPGVDGSKTKPAKSQGKQKQAGEEAEKVAEEDGERPTSVEQEPAPSEENKAVKKKKPAKKGRRKGQEEKEAVTPLPPAPVEETVAQSVEVDDKKEELPMTSTPCIPAVRRSRREPAVRKTPEATLTTPIRKTRKQIESKEDAAAADLPDDSPADVSTPRRRRSKHGVFVAEMLCPPDKQESPIRIKFTRVQRNVSSTKAESGKNTPVAAKASSDAKKRKQAKKLVEKAKVIQQSKKASKEKGTVRRSSRAEASAKRSYCEDEDSVICLEESQSEAPEKTQKSLRSLNDVLGKATSAGSKVSSLAQEKSARKVSIFDDSSRDGSESTQDDEQFRARREFLKSGLPESFKKQIAKTAASKEAYSLSCSSFQPVIHIQQQLIDRPLWSLLWPEPSSLRHLKELWYQTFSPLQPVCGALCVKTKPACRASFERGSGWRPEISEGARQLLVEEVRTSNPSFPVQMFLSRFLKRRTDHQQQSTASEPEAATKDPSSAGGKRKRADDDGETTVKVAKKQRANSTEEKISTSEPEPPKRGGRTRRGQRAKQEDGGTEKTKPSVKAAPVPPEDDSVVVVDDVLLVDDDAEKKDVVKEDVLWTDKYQPQHSSDIIGNPASVRRLHSWLKEWKLRTDREERKKQKEKKQEESSNDSDCGEDDSQDGDDMLCNTMIITGPTGVGKTAAVYACAQELGFKVFEVNASSQRSGRLILSQLKEATQSHQVDSQGVNAHKPTYFNSYGTSSSAGIMRPGSSPRKINSPRRVVSSPRKHPQSPRGAKRGGLAPTALANFFKMGRPTNKETPNTKKNEQTEASKKDVKANDSANKGKASVVKSATSTAPKEKSNEEQNKKTATSLILFEEVDVIFDDDSGFLAAIKTFMSTTKRPVILTTSDPAFSSMFDGNFEEILFKSPSVVDVSSFLRLLCLTEDVRTDQSDVSSLLRLNDCDIRQSLLQLQFWTRSGGRGHRSVTEPLTQSCKNAETKPETDEKAACALPPCDSGCTESLLGLLNSETERDMWELLKSRSLVEEELCFERLTNNRRRGVDLLYSNMEMLLPVPCTQLTTSTYKLPPPPPPSQDPLSDTLPSHQRLLLTSESADDSSPVKMSNRMRKNKRRHCLPEQEGLDSDSDSEDNFLSLCKPQEAPPAKEAATQSLVSEKVKRTPLTPEEQAKSLPVSQGLESMADFFDNMSYMDSSLLVRSEGGDSAQRKSQTGAVVKDGMTDEPRIDMGRASGVSGELVWEIPAAVEALSFQKCRVSLAEAWEKAQQLEGDFGKEAAAELSLPVAAHREGFSFSQDGLCRTQLVQRRREVMESLTVRGVFGSLCNRPAAALDFMPALRTICRSEQLKEQGKVKRRFLHYLDSISLGLEKSTLQHLAEDFP
ncbi:ATPase family AAA domain-containing protein 5 isoform X2 [Labrus mixtus]|uniref:ATPase family AAA domain-containing protein 5 isoform X2 n=1 Tax=Labrus mixtus TaxID=508554 RepID=UPI0029BFD834|nr:ATPase family AAA domain-containing protein 5 isoform X2 [Labrus mixtus]